MYLLSLPVLPINKLSCGPDLLSPQDALQYPLLDLPPSSSPLSTPHQHDVLILHTRGLPCNCSPAAASVPRSSVCV